MRLIGAVVGILPQDHHLDLIQLGQLEGIEHIGSWRVDHLARFPLGSDSCQRTLEIVLLFLRANHITPGQHPGLLT